MEITKQDLAIIASLLGRVQITGSEATTVAILLQKIDGIIKSQPETKPQGDGSSSNLSGTLEGKIVNKD